jgi:hypothetical protein
LEESGGEVSYFRGDAISNSGLAAGIVTAGLSGGWLYTTCIANNNLLKLTNKDDSKQMITTTTIE